MNEITDLMKSYKETRLAPLTMRPGYMDARAAVNCVALITEQKWEEVLYIIHSSVNVLFYQQQVQAVHEFLKLSLRRLESKKCQKLG